jgi:hypothetical protein
LNELIAAAGIELSAIVPRFVLKIALKARKINGRGRDAAMHQA